MKNSNTAPKASSPKAMPSKDKSVPEQDADISKEESVKAPQTVKKNSAHVEGTESTPKIVKKVVKKVVATKSDNKEEEEHRKALQKKFMASKHQLSADKTWKKFIAERKEELEEMRDDILNVVQEVTRSALKVDPSSVSSASGEHQADAGSEAQDRDLALNLLAKDREALYEIDAALERIRLGRYGICEISQDIIPRGRLEARPYVRLTVQCQTEYEKLYGNNARYNPASSGNYGFAGTEKELESSVLLDDNEE